MTRPTPLTVAAALVGLQALALAVYGVLEIAHLTSGRATVAVTTSIFFLGYAAALTGCAYGLLRLVSWTRSPVVLTQLIELGLAWSFRDMPQVAVPLALVAFAVLVCIFAPASVAALEPDSED
ncbi:MAG TPA: hypothetical protein VGE38_01895 [Nocardioides sp.]|uniref:hypothetical protein n=1 Tax=Nocardioides sp. TaxID=35761 RepID=UPI002ED96334